VTDIAVATALAVPLLVAAVLALGLTPRYARVANAIGAVLVASGPAELAVRALAHPSDPLAGTVFRVDSAAAVLLLVIAGVGLLSALASTGRDRRYTVAFYVFWAALIAVPVAANLAVAWLLVEATTAASALLIATGGGPRALEAGWKYLVLTTLGLAVALLGIVALYASLAGGGGTLATLDWDSIHAGAAGLGDEPALFALVLILGGLAGKVGWAPVHNWLPDAHSEAPPPVSALLSAALLPAVILVGWRTTAALEPATGDAAATLLIAFGLASLAVAVPFLWRSMPLKRLLAYSSLEHMGVLALGIAFATPLATAGVVLHIAGHALAKSLGFYAAMPLVRADPRLASRPLRGEGGAAVGLSLGALAGLPPSPLFFSEVLILLGGVQAGETAVVAVAAVLLALGFLGLAHALIEGVAGDRAARRPRLGRPLASLTAIAALGLLALAATAAALPDSAIVRHLLA
jgi:hydrogenase-4 component F